MNVKTISRMLLAFSAVMIYMAMTMDTTVSTGYGRVNNLGLLNDQSNMLILGGIGFIAGIILFATAKIKQTSEDEVAEKQRLQGIFQGAEVKLEKVNQVIDSLPNKIFNYFQTWIAALDNVRGRAIVFVVMSPLAMLTWLPLIIPIGLYAVRRIPASKVMTHLLTVNILIYISFLLIIAFTDNPNWNTRSISWFVLIVFATLASIVAIVYVNRSEAKKISRMKDY